MSRSDRLVLFIILAASISASGCYLSHGLGGDSPGFDGGGVTRRDAGGRRDTGPSVDASPPAVDASPPLIDAGPLPSDEPDVRPGQRPSDDPGAAQWTDPPPIATEDPCCELIGDPVPLDDPNYQGGPPAVAWNGAGWGVAWEVFDIHSAWFRELDELAQPVAPARVFGRVGSTWMALAWGNHRYGFWGSESSRAPQVGLAGVLDIHGELRSGLYVNPGVGRGRIARFPAIHGWAVAGTDPSAGDGSAVIRVLRLDDSGHWMAAPAVVAEAQDFEDGVTSVVGLVSQAEVVWAGADGVRERSLYPDGTLGDTVDLMTMDPYFDERGQPRSGHAIVATDFRDSVVVAGADGSHIHVVVYDPFDDAIVGAPGIVADSPVVDARMGLAGNAKNGFIGLCYPYGTRGVDASQVRFQLLGPTGAPRGAPLVIADHLRYAAGCAVGASHSEFIVIYWDAARSDVGHKMFAQRVRPR